MSLDWDQGRLMLCERAGYQGEVGVALYGMILTSQVEEGRSCSIIRCALDSHCPLPSCPRRTVAVTNFRPEVLALVLAAQELIALEAKEPLSDEEIERIVDYLAKLELALPEIGGSGSGQGKDAPAPEGDGRP